MAAKINNKFTNKNLLAVIKAARTEIDRTKENKIRVEYGYSDMGDLIFRYLTNEISFNEAINDIEGFYGT